MKKNQFQVRKQSVIQPVSETVVTRTWLENAIRIFEDENHVVLMNTKFDRDKDGAYQAVVKAEIGEQKATKTFEWIIKEAPKLKVCNVLTTISRFLPHFSFVVFSTLFSSCYKIFDNFWRHNFTIFFAFCKVEYDAYDKDTFMIAGNLFFLVMLRKK